MKKLMTLLICMLTMSMTVRADDDRPVRFDQLPEKAQTCVKKYFAGEKVALAKMEKDFFDKKYEVIFADGSKVEFYKDGVWKEVDCKYSVVPGALIPDGILRYVKATYPGEKVVKIEKEDRGRYEVKLASGLKLEFDKKFNLIDIDD